VVRANVQSPLLSHTWETRWLFSLIFRELSRLEPGIPRPSSRFPSRSHLKLGKGGRWADGRGRISAAVGTIPKSDTRPAPAVIASPRRPRDLLSLPRARISPREGSTTQRAVGGHGQCPLGEGGNQYPSRDRAYGSRFPFPFSRLPCGGSRAILEIDGGTPQPFPSTLKASACETGMPLSFRTRRL